MNRKKLIWLTVFWVGFLLTYIFISETPQPPSSRDTGEITPKSTISVEVKPLNDFDLTFYTHTGNRTASGVYPKAGRTVAVDKSVIPLGSILYVEGYGILIAEDTGGDIKGNRLDIFVDMKEEAVKLGRKQAKVYILNTGIDSIEENLYNKDIELEKGIKNATKATN